MPEDKSTHATHGMTDHHHIKAKSEPLDRTHRADKATLDTAWDILQGKVKPVDIEEPLDPGEQTASVSFEYVGAVSFAALRELKRRGCGSGFSVERGQDEPKVKIRWERPGALALPAGMAKKYQQVTDCLPAWMQERDPQHVGIEAADLFLRKLEEAEAR
jgi:hypothetical protein